jgi:predicted ABC-type transport system involved in lysophospholipase L1 biosynthesis ATPase subunit
MLLNAGSFCVNQTAIMPLGLISVATHLENIGHKVRLIDRPLKNVSAQAMADFRPDIVGISAITFMSFSDAKKISKQ